jgi:hypothetical protein
VLSFFGLDVGSGFLLDPEELSLQVFDASTVERKMVPLEVLAETPVNLVSERIGVGVYAPTWTAPADGAVGEHVARWRYRFAGGVEQVVDEMFEVLTLAPFQRGPMYTSIAAVREHGLGVDSECNALSDPTIAALIIRASLRIERITGRVFEPRSVASQFDGSGTGVLRFSQPIVAFGGATVDSVGVAADDLHIYNRHLRGLAFPDDRDDPRVASDSRVFTAGRQNVTAYGVFGFTEPAPGSLWGTTPPAIAHAARLLVGKERDPLAATQAPVGPVMEERTRDQSVKYGASIADAFAANGWTGDPNIDQILVEYMRPPFMGVV